MIKRIITISREFGSGGRTIGKEVAQKLGYSYYDKELVRQVAVETGFDEKYIEQAGEYAPSKNWLSFGFAARGSQGAMEGMSANDFLWAIQCRVIRSLAEKEPCVIVGRCADYILRDREDVLNVFLYADQADKLAYAMDTYGDRPEEAEQRVRQVDASRESYYHYLTRAKWGDLKRYHLSLNTSPIGKEGGADLIVQYAKLRRAKLGL